MILILEVVIMSYILVVASAVNLNKTIYFYQKMRRRFFIIKEATTEVVWRFHTHFLSPDQLMCEVYCCEPQEAVRDA